MAGVDAEPRQGARRRARPRRRRVPLANHPREECSAYWPAGTAAWHINADIAMAFERYRTVTGDHSLEKDCGLAVLVETARLWLSLGHHDRHGVWHLDGSPAPTSTPRWFATTSSPI
ncbi:glycosyl hydrolase family 65 central catalytic domain protein [Mycobacterium kansasii]|uniref:Glycosyl hydrolase family 65 central catalytic domain protein n=1 Tax=Mycobacterium kansasii TaxID=1768 RepID=A0A1V3WMG5_MYCKA|nr:glycosyl hydrolase family 65 central catalytic domain protein [Mycobacterium kansasii]